MISIWMVMIDIFKTGLLVHFQANYSYNLQDKLFRQTIFSTIIYKTGVV